MSAPMQLPPWQESLPAVLSRCFRRHLELDAATGCWLWTAGKYRDGYGMGSHQNRTGQTHRIAYTAIKGPVPAGLVLDHLCRVRHCCNPDHLEPVTVQENCLRGAGSGPICRKGHQRTYLPEGWRCLECYRVSHRDRERRRRARLREEATRG